MSNRKRRKLDSTVAAVQKQYGPAALRRGLPATTMTRPPHVATGFPALDAATGCGGIPLGALTVISGATTSGKLTLAYKTLAQAQRGNQVVAIIDLNCNSDPDYLARCGLDLARLLLVRPTHPQDVGALAVDLARSRGVQMVLVDSLVDVMVDRTAARQLVGALGRLTYTLRATGAGALFVDDPGPPWQRWPISSWLLSRSWPVRQQAALWIDIRHERWLQEEGVLRGYAALARVERSRWRHDRPRVPLEIRFNGTVKAHATW